jgi:hypothetical protein
MPISTGVIPKPIVMNFGSLVDPDGVINCASFGFDCLRDFGSALVEIGHFLY